MPTTDSAVEAQNPVPKLIEVKERRHPSGELPVIPYGWHFISLCLGAGFDLKRRRGRHWAKASPGRGEVILDPGYEANIWMWDQPVHLVHVNLSWSLLERLVIETGKERADVELAENLAFVDLQTVRLLTAIHQEAREANWGDALATEALGSYLAIHLLRHFNVRPLLWDSSKTTGGTGLGASALRQVIEYVEEHLPGNIRVADLATVAGVSTYHFIRSFKQSVGVSPHQYVLEQRVNRARYWLQHRPKMTVAEIAQRTGFSDQTHLARHLRRFTGTSPSELRKHVH